MKRNLLTLLIALTSIIAVNAQSFEWGTATWNIDNGKEFADIDEFNQYGLILSYPNPTDYSLTYFNMIAVDYDLYIDDATEPSKEVASAQGSSDVNFKYNFVEGHKYKIVTNSAILVFVNIGTRTTDTLSVSTDSYQITFSIKGPELVKTIEVEGTMALTITDQEDPLTYSKIDINDILSVLGATSISEVKMYGLNLNGSYNEHYSDYYDGWRDADGEYTTWYGGWDAYASHNAYPAVYCIKLNDTGDTVKYYFYDYWKEYNPDDSGETGGSVISGAKGRRAPETSYNTIIWDWDNGDGTVTKYNRFYRTDEGKDYKASFIYIANKKCVQLNATLHFVSQEAYQEYIDSQVKHTTYEGYIASGIAMPQAPGTPIATSSESQTLTITEKGDDTVIVTFSGFTFPMINMPTGELNIEAVKNVAEDGSITYTTDATPIGISRGGMISNYTGTLKGTQTNEDATPVMVLTLSQSTIITAVFGATAEEAANALNAAYEEATGISNVNLDNSGKTIYNINGTRQTSLNKGINVIKTHEGVKKVFVK